MTPEERIDEAIDRVLMAGGMVPLKWYGRPNLDKMRQAMRDIMSESYIAGSNACHKVMAEDRPKCEWEQDDEGNWGTSCGNLHSFIEDGPFENNHKFCPYCGGRLEAA